MAVLEADGHRESALYRAAVALCDDRAMKIHAAAVAMAVLLGGCSSAEERARADDRAEIRTALEKQRLQPTGPSVTDTGSPAYRKTVAALAEVQPRLEDPELAGAVKTVVEGDREAQALPKSGKPDAHVEVTDRMVRAMQVYAKACSSQ
ncbi:hypothetical protein ACFVH6_41915 [Spirillospora sp. NPDC127200]